MHNLFQILFLRCHDLRNVLQTIASKDSNDNKLSIHINHPCPLSFARNALILKVISDPNFDVNKQEDVDYLWDVWYNAEWPKSTLDRFVQDVQDLIEKGLPENCNPLQRSQLDNVQHIWRGWLSSLKLIITVPSQKTKILKER